MPACSRPPAAPDLHPAAEFYARYEQAFKPADFNMAARVADCPNGMLGDLSLFLVWLN